MATISITIPNADLNRVVDGIAGQHSYPDTVPDENDPDGPEIANPETKTQFAKRQLAIFAKESVKAYEATQAAEAARQAAVDHANALEIT